MIVNDKQGKEQMNTNVNSQNQKALQLKQGPHGCNLQLDGKQYLTIKRKTQICYYVMKLAEFGEIYSFIEHTERFSESATRYMFDQLIDGIHYLHSHGIVHRDIKPENLLVNKKGKIIIADFSFAIRMKEIDCDGIFQKKFE